MGRRGIEPELPSLRPSWMGRRKESGLCSSTQHAVGRECVCVRGQQGSLVAQSQGSGRLRFPSGSRWKVFRASLSPSELNRLSFSIYTL